MIIPYDIKHGIVSEEELVIKSDLVICTSRQLYNEKKPFNPNTHFIPNAADIEHSRKALDDDLPINDLVAKLKKPVIGYTGTIERRINYELMKTVVETNKDKSFLFVGPMAMEFVPEWFTNTANIFLTGRLPHELMPGIIKGFDIAIIPFKKDDVSGTIFPLKLFEYLGAGKPVIATDFNPDIDEFTKGTVEFCKDAESFSDAIENILEHDSKEKQDERLRVAEANTWENRVKQISDLIVKNLN